MKDSIFVPPFAVTFGKILRDVSFRYARHYEVKKDSWQEMDTNALMGCFSEEVEEFWDACPDNLEEMYSEIQDVILVAMMVAEKVKGYIELEKEQS